MKHQEEIWDRQNSRIAIPPAEDGLFAGTKKMNRFMDACMALFLAAGVVLVLLLAHQLHAQATAHLVAV